MCFLLSSLLLAVAVVVVVVGVSIFRCDQHAPFSGSWH